MSKNLYKLNCDKTVFRVESLMSLGVIIQTNYAWGLIAKNFSRNLIFLVPQIDDQRVAEVKKFDRKPWSKIFDLKLKINILNVFVVLRKIHFDHYMWFFRKLTLQIKTPDYVLSWRGRCEIFGHIFGADFTGRVLTVS